MKMMTTDPIADMLTRIRNAAMVKKAEVEMPHSKLKQTIAEVLARKNFVDKVETKDNKGYKTLKIVINRSESNSRITEIERLSKPGRRLYKGAKEIPSIKRGRGIVIISTSKGVMTGDEAKQAGLGGELICKVY
ncbi:30S ribosomal protein S8 [Candidatus Saccharibacteria bacterium]|nr:30S ribosomal protein S8 [Candidatus Saccharibacteria bacterium]